MIASIIGMSAVIEEAGIVEPALPVVDVLLVQGPADALRRDKAQYRHIAGLGIDLDVAELRREAGRH